MAVKTTFSADEYTRILENYDLGAYIDSEPFNGGTVQTNIWLQTTKGRYAFRFYESRTKDQVLFETELLSYLKGKHYPCAAPYRNRDGCFVGIFHQKPYVIFEYMDGQHVEAPNERQKQQLIQKAAELHNLSQEYTSVYQADRWNYNVEFCRALARQASERIDTANAKEKCVWLENELLSLELPTSLPKGICHADFHFSNVLFQQDELSALLDFDDANYTFLLFDLVGLIESWAWRYGEDEVLDFSVAKNILEEYTKWRSLNDLEDAHLFDVYKLSILIDCVWYFERGDVQDCYERRKIEFLNQVGRTAFRQKLFGSA